MRALATSLAAMALSIGTAHADESTFLESLEGDWMGSGTVKVRTDSSPIKVSCVFNSDTTASSLSLDGRCTGLLIFSRAIGADLQSDGTRYSGSYVGAGTGTAALTGSRSGSAINLNIQWAKQVNGDRSAQLTIEKLGEAAMRLTTTDTDPKSGKKVMTSRIDLRRS